MFINYANEESDDAIGGFTKTVQHSIMNISSQQCSSNLAPHVHQKKKNKTKTK